MPGQQYKQQYKQALCKATSVKVQNSSKGPRPMHTVCTTAHHMCVSEHADSSRCIAAVSPQPHIPLHSARLVPETAGMIGYTWCLWSTTYFVLVTGRISSPLRIKSLTVMQARVTRPHERCMQQRPYLIHAPATYSTADAGQQ